MTEIDRLDEQLRKVFTGGAWYGPSVREVLDGVTAEVAAARPLKAAHSIWELVNHLTAWSLVVSDRIETRRQIEQPSEGDFPPVTDESEAAWQASLQRLEAGYVRLRSTIARLEDEQLDRIAVEGGQTTVYTQLQGAIHHYVYHAAQIALLKKV